MKYNIKISKKYENDFLPLMKQGAIPEQSQANCESIVLKNCFDVNSRSNALRWNAYNSSFQYIGIPTETVGTSKNLLRQGSGTTYSSVNKDIINDFDLIVPSNELTWKDISTLLSYIDNKIELNSRINKELEAMAKTLYDYWFVQFDFPHAEGKPYKSSGGKMVYNEELKREIPEGWEVEELKKHISIERGLSYKSNELCDTGIPMINLNSFYLNGTYKPEGIKYFTGKYNSNKITKPEELIIATTDVTRNADIIGKALIVPNIYEKDVVLSCDVAKVICKSSLDKFFLEKLYNSESYHNYIKGFASGTLVLHLNTDGMDWYKLCIPPKNILNKFSEFMKNIQKKKDLTIKENQHLTQLRDFLLPMLMNGQVSVK